MTKLEAVIERLRALPEAEQEMRAVEIELLLKDGQSLLTPEQWAELERRLANENEATVPHEDVVARMRTRHGG